MTIRTLHPGKLSLYTILSISDLFLTHRLVQQSDGLFYESNPIANAWLTAYGWVGLAAFKVAAMLLVAVMAAYISFLRPRAGGYVLRFACCAVATVVLYSCWLAGSFGRQPAMPESLGVIHPVARKAQLPSTRLLRLPSATSVQARQFVAGWGSETDPVDVQFIDYRNTDAVLLVSDQE
jgi:hypothetical protein